MWLRTLVLVFVVCGALAERRRYDGYKIFEVIASTKEQQKLLSEMASKGLFEIFKDPGIKRAGYILVPPNHAASLSIELLNQNMMVSVQDNNVQETMDKEFQRLDARYETDPFNFDIDDFNRLEAIYQQYDRWAAACPSGLECRIIDIGKTFEGRSQKVFKIGKAGSRNRAIWLESILHSREWLAMATELKMINKIITEYNSNPEVTTLVNKYDWYFLAVGNPDGYVFSWDSDRFWRKNRRPPFAGAWCTGSDLNRNFEAYFGREGVSSDICAATYPGPGPNSEPETQNIARFGRQLVQSQNVVAWMCVHTMGKMWMFPYGHTYGHQGVVCARTNDHADLQRVTNVAVSALEATLGETGTWRKGTICEVIYPATGDEISFSYDILKVKYSFALELRGSSFVVDKSEIPRSAAEVWNGVAAMLNEIERSS